MTLQWTVDPAVHAPFSPLRCPPTSSHTTYEESHVASHCKAARSHAMPRRLYHRTSHSSTLHAQLHAPHSPATTTPTAPLHAPRSPTTHRRTHSPTPHMRPFTTHTHIPSPRTSDLTASSICDSDNHGGCSVSDEQAGSGADGRLCERVALTPREGTVGAVRSVRARA